MLSPVLPMTKPSVRPFCDFRPNVKGSTPDGGVARFERDDKMTK
jgi:hypothetical protein